MNEAIRAALRTRSIVMVGIMGCGKSAIGRRLASRLALPFVDADDEIEAAARKSIPEIFADHGEAYFRDGERKVIARLLRQGPQVLATGGGAYMNGETRDTIRNHGVSVWLRAELPVLMRRVMRRDNRPLLKSSDPEAVMRALMDQRYPVYAEADIVQGVDGIRPRWPTPRARLHDRPGCRRHLHPRQLLRAIPAIRR
jgi:shikimate kinase